MQEATKFDIHRWFVDVIDIFLILEEEATIETSSSTENPGGNMRLQIEAAWMKNGNIIYGGVIIEAYTISGKPNKFTQMPIRNAIKLTYDKLRDCDFILFRLLFSLVSYLKRFVERYCWPVYFYILRDGNLPYNIAKTFRWSGILTVTLLLALVIWI